MAVALAVTLTAGTLVVLRTLRATGPELHSVTEWDRRQRALAHACTRTVSAGNPEAR